MIRIPKALATLTFAQALGLSAAPLVVMVGGVVGRELAPSPALATLPLATMVVGTALTAAPAALLMQRIGRRRGLVSGALTGVAGAGAAAFAVQAGSFAAFCFATLLVGAHLAFVMQYRFAAAEVAGPQAAARAVAYVLTGGIVAGLLGPELGRIGRDLLATPWTGSFIAMAAVCAALAAVLFAGLDDDRPAPAPHRADARRARDGGSVRRLLRTPEFVVAAAAAITAYAVMSLIMTATPLAMHGAGFGVDATARVIQAHVVAMFAPSLIAGPLAARLGLVRLMAAGLVVLATCVVIGFAADGLGHWIGALVLLGIGWNLLFLGGTVALARAFPDADRFRAQGLNDLLVYGTQAMASLGAGVVLAAGGWAGVTLVAAGPVVGLAAMLAVRGRRVMRAVPAR